MSEPRLRVSQPHATAPSHDLNPLVIGPGATAVHSRQWEYESESFDYVLEVAVRPLLICEITNNFGIVCFA
jgi:hypothetical protein